jgi:hypothetical protein
MFLYFYQHGNCRRPFGEADDNERKENEDIFIIESKNDVQKQTRCNQAWKRNWNESLES